MLSEQTYAAIMEGLGLCARCGKYLPEEVPERPVKPDACPGHIDPGDV